MDFSELIIFSFFQSFRVAATLAARRAGVVSLQSRSAVLIPKFGPESEMQKEAIEQIRARVKYQKELMASKHGHGTEEEMWRWVNITFMVAVPICIVSLLYSYFCDDHVHRIDGEMPEYMTVRSKEFPWECGECDLFDLECWKKCRAAKK